MPQWTDLPLRPLANEGTDHALYQLGADLLVRLPKVEWSAGQAKSDSYWLPKLAPSLPVEIPAPAAVGEPGEGYPWPWTVVPWIAGDNPNGADRAHPSFAEDLAGFVRALHAVDIDGVPSVPDGARGTPLPAQDESAQAALRALAAHDDGLDLDLVARVWADAVRAPVFDRSPVWLHADLQPGNLIVRETRLVAVIDFGGAGVGDPAPDIAAAFWTIQGHAARQAFRNAVGCDDATWRRARGWALLPSLTGLNYYRHTFPRMVTQSLETIEAVVEDVRGEEITVAGRRG
jgi:aminoglycoside phosphotransferase (APT) family kinase protein